MPYTCHIYVLWFWPAKCTKGILTFLISGQDYTKIEHGLIYYLKMSCATFLGLNHSQSNKFNSHTNKILVNNQFPSTALKADLSLGCLYCRKEGGQKKTKGPVWKSRSRGWSDYFGSACLCARGPELSPFTAHSPFSAYTVPGNRRSAGRSGALIKRWQQRAQRQKSPHPISWTPHWAWPGTGMRKGEAGVQSWPGWKCRSLLTLYFALQWVVLSWDGCQSHKIKWGKCEKTWRAVTLL